MAHSNLDLLVAKSTAHNVTNPEVAFDFYHQFSKLELNLSADTETGLTDADLAGVKGRIKGINRPATFHFVDQTVSYATALDEDVFMQVAANGLSASAIIPSVKGSEIIFVLAIGDSFTWDISSLSFESGKCYTYSIALKANPIAVEAQLTSVISDWNKVQGGLISLDQDADTGNTSDPTSGNESGNSTDANGYDYVDLGLTSGLLWATKNVGATLMTDYGSYFAWGETVGYAQCTSHDFSTDTYKWYKTKTAVDNDGNTVTAGGYTKYMPQSYAASYGYEGFYDDKKVLETADDAAAANWGGDWRMPTNAEWKELMSQCTWTWLTLNGVNGYKVESKTNGNYIFLPGSYCYYWSSSLHESNPYYARYLYFYSSSVTTGSYYRYCGYSVRAVRSAE